MEIPKGWKIEEQSDDRVVLVKEKTKPVWEDFGDVKGYYISLSCDIEFNNSISSMKSTKDLWPTEEEAEAALALSQLCQWRDKYNGCKRRDLSVEDYYCISLSYGGKISSFADTSNVFPLIFKSPEIRDKFYEDFKELIEIAKPLL